MFDETSPSLSHFFLLQMTVIIFKINVRDKLVGHILAIGPRLCSPQLKLGLKTIVNNSIYTHHEPRRIRVLFTKLATINHPYGYTSH